MKPLNLPGREWRLFPSRDIELRFTSSAVGSAGRLIGHAAVFNDVAELGRFSEKIAPGAFVDSIRRDDIRALFNHDPNFILGRNKAGTLTLREDSKGLAIEIALPATKNARDLVTAVRRGDVSGMSIGFDVLDEAWSKGAGGAMVRTLKKVKLFDVGPVTYPAYASTDVSVRLDSGPHGLRSKLSVLRWALNYS